ncbi:DeoR/GlpR family DNA-binding transcription regulator [Pseudonocardia sp. TRM90224]|uniref:DeoR/GlpR family DNA-binding transcription regulator n=1 Tax=Pseudonocardia sp. TRM90224 TaxID=2812678 RepID=UPI001E3D2D5A|nr:DeoR/GlpR family DNA-binding transcription regulator [Pseudonocardia sp. TRM90224]
MPFDEFDREQAILLELGSSGRVTVSELAERFGVSTVTVRKDLDALERRTLLRRIRGGAVSVGVPDEGAFQNRLHHAAAAKQAIARAAAGIVGNGDVVALDSSSTCFYLAQELVDRRNLVVVTNGLRSASLLMEESSALVFLPGGVLRRAAASVVGPIGDVLAGRGRIGKGFFGVAGLSIEHGLMDVAPEEAQAKAQLVGACNEVYGLFDASKIGRFALHPFVATGGIDALYTDDAIDPAVVAEWGRAGVPVRTVAVPEGAS